MGGLSPEVWKDGSKEWLRLPDLFPQRLEIANFFIDLLLRLRRRRPIATRIDSGLVAGWHTRFVRHVETRRNDEFIGAAGDRRQNGGRQDARAETSTTSNGLGSSLTDHMFFRPSPIYCHMVGGNLCLCQKQEMHPNEADAR